MTVKEINEQVEAIRTNIKRAQFKDALDKLDILGKAIGDAALDSRILLLQARYNQEFKSYLDGLSAGREEFNKIILATTYVLQDAAEIAAEKFKTKAPLAVSTSSLVERISLESNTFHQAVKGLNLKDKDRDLLLDTISILEEAIQQAQGKRILWIDDRPHKIIGERRFFRSLGLSVQTANTREAVLQILEQDGDFDIIISDIQWRNKHGGPTFGGLNVVKELREQYEKSFIGQLKVVFYTGYKEAQINRIHTKTGIKDIKNSAIIYSIDKLVAEICITLAQNTNRVYLGGSKTPT